MASMQKLDRLAQASIPKKDIPETPANYWAVRCVRELQYAAKLSQSESGAYDKLISDAVDIAWDAYREGGAVTKPVTLAVEQALAPMADKAKAYTLLCIGHAHIDMNWMWSYDETVSITLDTFRTMLDLMEEYPEYTFGQSQASVYRIVERHLPSMIPEIKKRVHEGRWEVTASTWVEADRNMPNMESMARHLLYTKQYLSGLLDIDPQSLDIDYEPDTFGHNVNVPEVLADGGVKYYYHCRGFEEHTLYNWKAPSGRQILVFREPSWYNWDMDGRSAILVPDFCRQNGIDTMLRVYGVGDHGGGPTRRDIERIIDMDAWPIFPAYKFGTYGEFYRLAEKNRQAYPTVEGELNFIFDGCFTTQTRQKKGNRVGEALIAEAEGAAVLSRMAIGAPCDGKAFAEAWEKVLFNQFHDILPGSGVTDTREYAMAQYQEAFATANTALTMAVRALSDAADTSAFALDEDIAMTRSEGAGVGYGLTEGRIAQLGRHAGKRRLFTVYNPHPFPLEDTALVSVWDWDGDTGRMRWTDAAGNSLSHQVVNESIDKNWGGLDKGLEHFWSHSHAEVLVRVKLPAAGYTTIVLDEGGEPDISLPPEGPRVEGPPDIVLENECIRAVFDVRGGGIVSLIDKKTGNEYAKPGVPMGVFRLIQEDTVSGMSAWRVGKYRNIAVLNSGVRVMDLKTGPQYLRQSLIYETGFGNGSKLVVMVSLDRGEAMLRFDTKVLWQEIGSYETCYPQLSFMMPVAYDYEHIRYDVPMGALDRKPLEMDVPVQSYGMPISSEGPSLMLVSDSKYGYRGVGEGLSLTLIRSSADPDPWPEIGKHRFRMAIALSDNDKVRGAQMAKAFCRAPVVTSARAAHDGTLPAAQSLMELSGEGLILSAVKPAEDGAGIIVRYYEAEGKSGRGEIRLFKAPVDAAAVNLLEQPTGGDVSVQGNTVSFGYKAFGVGSLKIMFKREG